MNSAWDTGKKLKLEIASKSNLLLMNYTNLYTGQVCRYSFVVVLLKFHHRKLYKSIKVTKKMFLCSKIRQKKEIKFE